MPTIKRQKIKKIAALLIAFALAPLIFACGANDGKAASASSDSQDIYTDSTWISGDQQYPAESSESPAPGQDDTLQDNDADDPELFQRGDETTKAIQLMYDAFDELKTTAVNDPARLAEVTPETKMIRFIDDETDDVAEMPMEVCTIEMGKRQMQFTMEVIGEPDEDGLYPLYITMHGGGESDPESNNEQWMVMADYYSTSVENGIYVATRGMEDVWNLHFLDDSYAMYDRLIEDMILLKNADPDRVYLMGYSAGGDGVYAIAPRMADRFAAVNMSSGHPNGVSLLNVSNLPFEIQVGIRDLYSEDALRSIRGAECENTLNEYANEYGYEYPHRVLVHVPEGHHFNDYADEDGDTFVLNDPGLFAKRAVAEDWPGQFLDLYSSMGNDRDISSMSYDGDPDFDAALLELVTDKLKMELVHYADTNAVTYVDNYVRNSCPDGFVWDLSTRAPGRHDNAFYWLKADYSVDHGVIDVFYDDETNTVVLDTDGNLNGDITILANPFLIDFDRPLNIETAHGKRTVDLHADMEIVKASMQETGDMYLSWADEIVVSQDEL